MKTFKDVYKFPLRSEEYDAGYVFDSNDNLVFQFMDNKYINLIIDILNDKIKSNYTDKFHYWKQEQIVFIDSEPRKMVLIIRGWGNLTGTGGMKLSNEEAINIQDTFAEFIISKLNDNENIS